MACCYFLNGGNMAKRRVEETSEYESFKNKNV